MIVMDVKSLLNYGIPENFINKFKDEKIEELYPPQIDAIKKGALDGKNLLLAMPTASGKTFIATLASIKNLLNRRSKVVYIVQLKN